MERFTNISLLIRKMSRQVVLVYGAIYMIKQYMIKFKIIVEKGFYHNTLFLCETEVSTNVTKKSSTPVEETYQEKRIH